MKLYYAPRTASFVAHVVLQEIGTPHELIALDLARNEHRSPDYLRINPNGLVPTLVDGDAIVWESAAIGAYLADRFPEAGLIPPVGSAGRGRYYQWMVWLVSAVQEHGRTAWMVARDLDAANEDKVRLANERIIDARLDILEAELAAGGPWLLGESYSTLDPLLFLVASASRGLPRPAYARPALRRHMEMFLQRPAVRRAYMAEGRAVPADPTAA